MIYILQIKTEPLNQLKTSMEKLELVWKHFLKSFWTQMKDEEFFNAIKKAALASCHGEKREGLDKEMTLILESVKPGFGFVFVNGQGEAEVNFMLEHMPLLTANLLAATLLLKILKRQWRKTRKGESDLLDLI